MRREPDDMGLPARLVETHTSVVVFLGDFVYKLKKAADLSFLDFRTRQAREAACHAEVELNRRLAPDVYLGVADVVGPDGTPFDHLVVMRRMPEDRRLSTLVHAGADVDGHVRALARLLADFHSRCKTSSQIATAGSPATLRGLWEEGLDALQRFTGWLLDTAVVDRIRCLALRYLAGREPLLAARQARARVRDGHGDLLADDIFCLDDGPRVLDCLEFAPRLRHGDVLADVAFLAMDLERLGSAPVAARLLGCYREFSAETHPVSLEHHYIAYRAFVRAKVACLRHEQDGDPATAEQARTLARIALNHLESGRVRLVLIGGLPGVGKSTLAAALVTDRDEWALLRSDVIRKELAGLPADAPAPAPSDEGLYAEPARERTYTELLRRARSALGMGESVVLDASWTSACRRAEARQLAAETSADLLELRCVAPARLATARIAGRATARIDASDAGPQIYRVMAAAADPWPTSTVIDTGGTVEQAVAAARAALA